MNLTTLRLKLRKYGAFVATLAVVVIAGVSLATVWYLQQSQGPVAPTAPASQPQASGNVCSVEWIVRNGCSDFKLFNADTGAEIPAAAQVTKGTKIQWACSGLPGTNYFKYRYRNNATENFKMQYEAKIKNMADPNNPRSTPLDTANLSYLEVNCRPFAGDFGATTATVRASCTRVITFGATQVQCNQACTTNADCANGNICSGNMCRNTACTGETDCICAVEPKTCGQSCAATTDCAIGLTCHTDGMCRRAACTSATDCVCPVDPTPVACAAGSFSETFTDATLDTKVRKVGTGTMTVANGVGTLLVPATQTTSNDFVAVEGVEYITGDFQSSVDLSALVSGAGNSINEVDFVATTPVWEKQYRISWQRGPNNVGSSLLVQKIEPGTPLVVTTLKTVVIDPSAAVTLRIIRKAGVLTIHSQLKGQSSSLLATIPTAEMLRPVVNVYPNQTGRSLQVAVDNFTLSCDTTIPEPVSQCSQACSATQACATGLICHTNGMCRRAACTAESDCECAVEPTPVACAAASFNEAFGDATLDAKIVGSGSGTMTIANGVATLLAPTRTDGKTSSYNLMGEQYITGDFQFSTDLRKMSTSSGPNQDRVVFLMTTSDRSKFYWISWNREPNNSTTQLLVYVGTTLKTIEIDPNASVTLRIIREAGVLKFYSQLNGADYELLATTPSTVALLPWLWVIPGGSQSSIQVDVDNFALSCDTTVTNPPRQCSQSCSSTDDCATGLICHTNGMCRRNACTGEADCECAVETIKTSVLQVTELSCTNQNFDAKLTLKENGLPKSGISVEFTYNGSTKSDTTDENGLAQVGFAYSSGNKSVVAKPSSGYSEQSQAVVFSESCATATPTPVPNSCNNSCSANSDCTGGLVCSGGACRNSSCTNQSNCTCLIAQATATPIPNVKPTATPTPVPSCTSSCVTSSDCRNGLTCSAGMCRNASCTNKTNCVCDVAAGQPAATPAPQLPQAGSTTQTIALLTIGASVIAVGFGRWYYFKR